MLHRPDNWKRFCFALAVFWVLLCLADLILGDIAVFNTRLTDVAVGRGYIAAVRGLLLLLVLAVTATMTALLRRGLIIAPLLWTAQLVRLALLPQGKEMVRNLVFVAPGLNWAVLILIPVALSLLLWQSLAALDARGKMLPLVYPGLWVLLTGLAVAGNLFLWHWSMHFALTLWPAGYSIGLYVAGALLLALGAEERPVTSLALFFAGLFLPVAACVALWGGYDGLHLAILALLPWGNGGVWLVWLELMAITALPGLLVLAIHQFGAWRRGRKLMEIL